MSALLFLSRELVRGMLIALGAAMIVVLGCMWADDINNEQIEYCKMVAEGSWPDFKENFEKVCPPLLTHDL